MRVRVNAACVGRKWSGCCSLEDGVCGADHRRRRVTRANLLQADDALRKSSRVLVATMELPGQERVEAPGVRSRQVRLDAPVLYPHAKAIFVPSYVKAGFEKAFTFSLLFPPPISLTCIRAERRVGPDSPRRRRRTSSRRCFTSTCAASAASASTTASTAGHSAEVSFNDDSCLPTEWLRV